MSWELEFCICCDSWKVIFILEEVGYFLDYFFLEVFFLGFLEVCFLDFRFNEYDDEELLVYLLRRLNIFIFIVRDKLFFWISGLWKFRILNFEGLNREERVLVVSEEDDFLCIEVIECFIDKRDKVEIFEVKIKRSIKFYVYILILVLK